LFQFAWKCSIGRINPVSDDCSSLRGIKTGCWSGSSILTSLDQLWIDKENDTPKFEISQEAILGAQKRPARAGLFLRERSDDISRSVGTACLLRVCQRRSWLLLPGPSFRFWSLLDLALAARPEDQISAVSREQAYFPFGVGRSLPVLPKGPEGHSLGSRPEHYHATPKPFAVNEELVKEKSARG
jgi:hypothetical protein